MPDSSQESGGSTARHQFTPINDALLRRADEVLSFVGERGLKIVTAESCTAGLVAAVLSFARGASDTFLGGYVVYTKQQKAKALGLDPMLLRERGAVCEEVACQLAQGALVRSLATISIAVTGVAGPEPDEDGNPVGLVHLAAAKYGIKPLHQVHHFGNLRREQVLTLAVNEALALLKCCAAK
jgi:nicotinamide-nucleotide amidase